MPRCGPTLRRLSAALLWTALAASGAAAGPACLTFDVLGRPLPSGLATLASDPAPYPGADALGGDVPHPGPTERSYVRFHDGRLCLDGLAPGNYRLKIGPLGSREEVELGARGVAGTLAEQRLSLEPAGFALYAADGRLLRAAGELPLEYRPRAPVPENWARIRGTLLYPAKTASDDPALMMACVMFERCVFASLSGKLVDGKQSFDLAVPPGRIRQIVATSRRFAVFAVDPPYSPRGSESISFKPAQRLTMTFEMYPACKLSGRLKFPGAPPLPYDGGRVGERLTFSIAMISPWATQQLITDVAEDLTYEFESMPMGFWELKPGWFGAEKTTLGQTPPPGKWLEPGQEHVLDYEFTDEARIRIDPDGVAAKSPWQKKFSDMFPVALRVVGSDAGDFDPRKNMRFFLEPSFPIGFEEMSPGHWETMATGEADRRDWMRVAPGRYDLYLIRNVRWLDFLGTRVLAAHPGVLLKKGKPLSFHFSSSDYYPLGSGQLHGVVRYKRRWDWPRAYASRTLEEYERLFTLIVNLYDEKNRFVGVALGNMGNQEYDSMAGPLMRKDAATLDANHYYTKPREFRFRDLPAGKYRLQISIEGYPLREYDVAVAEGGTAELNVDMELP